MPEQTYSIGFGQNDFFYSTSDKQKLDNLLLTIPFNGPNLITWCKSKDNTLQITEEDKNNSTLLFQSKISDIVLKKENREDFINNYMPGNITINGNFNSLALGLTATNQPATQNSAPISGKIVIDTNNRIIPQMNLDIDSAASRMDYSTQNGNWNPGVTINAKIPTNSMLQYNPPAGPVTNPDGSEQKVTVSANTRNPRCKFVNNCTENHGHFASCKTQTMLDSATGQNYCKCVCTGPIENNNKPHSHCSEIDINDTAKNGLDATFVKQYLQDTTLTSVLKNITMNLNATFMGTGSKNIGGNLFADYADSKSLKETDLKIRNAMYDYYAEVITNRDLQKHLLDNQTFNNTATLISQDAIRSYRKQYLELFNVTTGIFLASAYIYISLK